MVSIIENNLTLKMARANLDNVPEFALPTGFAVRWYQPGDEAHWLRIHTVADHYNEITSELFRTQFRSVQERGLQSASTDKSPGGITSTLQNLRERQCYLLGPRGEVIGTGTAWFNDHFEGARWGRVHWVAMVPDYQGRGLSKPLLTVICRRLRELGHDRAYVSTTTARIPAIKLYLKFGFIPLVRDETDEAIWKKVLAPSSTVGNA